MGEIYFDKRSEWQYVFSKSYTFGYMYHKLVLEVILHNITLFFCKKKYG